MKVRYFCSFVVFILYLKLSVQLDLLRPYQKRHRELLKYVGELFHHEKFKSALMLSTAPISAECFRDLNELFQMKNYNESAQFFDAWGPIPSGLLNSRISSFGNFDECETAKIGNFRGKYSLLNVQLELENENFHLINLGICLPQYCTAYDILEIFSNNFNTSKKFLDLFGKSISDDNTKISFRLYKDKGSITYEDRRAAKIGIFVFSHILALVILSSFYEFIVNKMCGRPHPLLKSFSVFTNIKQLFQIKPKNSVSSKIIECVNGIRSLTLIWNVYGHAYMWSFSRSDSNEPLRMEFVKHVPARLFTAANLSVDSFLLLSGLLVAWIGLNKMSTEKGRINIKLTYLHRYLRLTPSYAATVLFASGLYIFVGSGPMWYTNTLHLAKNCQKYWWRSLFFVSNYYSFNDMCIGHSWFLAVDMQLNILSPFILMGLWKWPMKMIWILIFLMILISYFVFIEILSVNEADFAFDGLMMGNLDFEDVQMKTHMRATPWLIGVLLGYYLFQKRNRAQDLSKKQVALGWFLALFVIVLLILGPQHLYEHHAEPSVLESAIFESLGRCGWALSLSWIIFSCYMGYSNTINLFLSHELWQIIARLNYTIYIVKTFINLNNLGLQKTAAYFSHYDMIAEFWADLGISATLAIMLSVSVELPFMAIEKYFTKISRPRV